MKIFGTGQGFEVRASSKPKTAEVMIYDVIGSSFFEDGVTAKEFDEALKAAGAVDTLVVRINSPGGQVYEANAIHTMLINHSAKVEVKIDGLAASAATYIAMAGDSIEIAENALFMVHEARGGVMGTSDEMLSASQLLSKINDTMTAIYSKRTGQSEQQVRNQMSAETWFTASEAVDAGYADSLTASFKVAACADLSLLAEYRNAPDVGSCFANPVVTPAGPKVAKLNDYLKSRRP